MVLLFYAQFNCRSNILFKQPMLSSITNIHIKPFKYEVWQITLLMLIGFVLILLFLNKFKVNRGPSITVLDIIGLVQGAICQQGKYYLKHNIMLLVITNY